MFVSEQCRQALAAQGFDPGCAFLVVAQVRHAPEHAGLQGIFRLLPDLDLESAHHDAKSYPETSAQHHALWAAITAALIGKKLLEVDCYIDAAKTCALLAPGHLTAGAVSGSRVRLTIQ